MKVGQTTCSEVTFRIEMSLRIMNEYIFLKTDFKNIGWVFIGFVGFHRHIGLPSYDLVSVSFVWEKKWQDNLEVMNAFTRTSAVETLIYTYES